MSLFTYSGQLIDGKKKAGQITAKSEDQARKRLAVEMNLIMIDSIKLQPDAKQQLNSVQKPKANSKLQKLLYLQHGCCFFCGEKLSPSNASIEHLNPKAKGGTSTEDNEVVCHLSLNQTFGSMDLRRKFEFILRQKGVFKCPQ